MKKKKETAPVFNYPQPEEYDGGCKVGWYIYSNRDDAERAAKIAIKEARYKLNLGYDFGYQSPGSISEVDGKFRVCVP